MKITKKINPAKPEETSEPRRAPRSEKVTRYAFLAALAEMRALPPPQKIEFYICCNFQFVGEKEADGNLYTTGGTTRRSPIPSPSFFTKY